MDIKFFRYNKIYILIFSIIMSSCAQTEFVASTAKRVNKAVSSDIKKSTGVYKVGTPYQIQGTWYYPSENYEYDETGIASWYGEKFHGRRTANGEIYNMNAMTVAHQTLPMPSYVRVTNLENGRSLILRVNDRGPFARGRILDASRRSAQLLGFQKKGTAPVRIQILADKSRKIAAQMKSNIKLANIGSPIIVQSVPKPAVNVEVLKAPLGAKVLPVNIETNKKKKIANKEQEFVFEKGDSSRQLPENVQYGKPQFTRIFIQAGAFGIYENAHRAKAKLSSLGKVSIGQILKGDQDLFRVRLGPVETVAEADVLLDNIINSGYPDARVIID